MIAPTLVLLVALALAPAHQESARAADPYPPSTAIAEGISPSALGKLDALVQSFVDDEEVVGAELLVIVNGRTILHEGYGWSDREAERAMEPGSVFCVRSMTKPLIGTAILMLLDEDRLELDDRVSAHLPAFDVEGSREITVEQLLTHTSGLPLSLLLGKQLAALDGIVEVAGLGAGVELEFEPGTGFEYSDQGTDTLTALIEVASGMPAAEFVETRLLEPLGMRDSACVMAGGHALRARGTAKYAGTRGEWTRYWEPEQPPIFPFFLGSQGLYSTAVDYARFLELWISKGRVGRERLVAARLVRKALEAGPHPMEGATGFPGLESEYGFLMQLWTGPGEVKKNGKVGKRELVAFGHSGSDGTFAWAFPEQKAMVLYFTQSRWTPTGLRVEEALGELFLGVPYDPNLEAPPHADYLGYYWEGEGDLYRAIVSDGEDLALEIVGKAVIALDYAGEDRWKLRPDPSKVLAFERSEAGAVTGYRVGDHREYRFEPSAGLPSADELAARVAETHRLDLLESLGPMRMIGEVVIGNTGITGDLRTLIAWPDRFRFDVVAGEKFEHLVFDGERVRYASPMQPAFTVEGAREEAMRRDSTLAHFGDWHRWYPKLEVIQRLQDGEKAAFLVRAGDTSAPAATLFVAEKSGGVFGVDSLVYLDGRGRVGQSLRFGDFRDVSGMRLPFRTEARIAASLVGTIVTTIDEVELGVELTDDAFEL